jgi:hypothetical protein
MESGDRPFKKREMIRCENVACLKLIETTPTKCELCGDSFCSVACKQSSAVEHKKICVIIDKATGAKTLADTGYPSTSAIVYQNIGGSDYMPLPGPIGGPIRAKMIPVREEPYVSMLTENERERIMEKDVYYVVIPTDWIKLMHSELTQKQKADIGKLIHHRLDSKPKT